MAHDRDGYRPYMIDTDSVENINFNPSDENKIAGKKDYSSTCNLNDDDKSNDCWECSKFCFPIGCMVGED